MLRFATLFFDLLMRFEELVEQHRVHLVVAHAVGFSFFVADDKIRIHLVYILGHKSYGRSPQFLLRTGYQQVADVVEKLAADLAVAPVT